MPSRRAILISCPGEEDNYLRGAVVDPHNMENFLCSPRGGAWYKNEITTLNNPTEAELIKILNSNTQEYQLVYFSGHGYSQGDKRFICLKDTDITDTSLLIPACERLMVIIDACREFTPAAISGIPKTIEIYDSFEGISKARKCFDFYINNSDPGQKIVHATNAGSLAFDDNYQDGGAFTLALLNTALEINQGKESFQPLYIEDLLPHVCNRLRANGNSQNPELAFQLGNLTVPLGIEAPYRVVSQGINSRTFRQKEESPLLQFAFFIAVGWLAYKFLDE